MNRHKTITASRLRVHAASCAEAAAELARLSDDWPDAHDVFVSMADCSVDAGLLAWQPPLNVMIEVHAEDVARPETVALIDEFISRQIPLCLDDYVPDTLIPASVNFRFLLADAAARPVLAHAPASPLAKNLADGAAFDAAIACGYAGATGWFFLAPRQVPPGAEMNPSYARIIELLNLVRSNADVKDVELALKGDVTLAFKLLRYINSAGFGALGEVTSFRHAVALAGYEKLNRWLALLLVDAGHQPSAPALMQTAVIRGRFMERLGAHLLPKDALDNLFIAGAFSVLDILLGARFDVILRHLQLPAPVADALLRGEGAIASLLDLARTCETGTAEALRRQLERLGLTPAQCNSAQIEALAFADKLQFG